MYIIINLCPTVGVAGRAGGTTLVESDGGRSNRYIMAKQHFTIKLG